MQIASHVFNDHGHIPKQFTCLGENISPSLAFSDIPQNAKSLVLVVSDTNATPKPWIHWLVFNIPTTTIHVNAKQIPQGGTEGLANGNTFGYEGPCPKYFQGTHEYHFDLYALDTLLQTPKESNFEAIKPLMNGHIVSQATLVGLCTSGETPTE